MELHEINKKRDQPQINIPESHENCRNVSVNLGLGITFFPFVFSWFTLRKGHSGISRIISFSWLIILFAFSSMNNVGNEITNQSENQERTIASKEDEWVLSLPKSITENVTVTDHVKQVGLNSWNTLEDLSFNITSAGTTRFIGNQYVNHRAPNGGILVVVNYKVRNEGNSTKVISANNILLVDRNGRTFEPSSGVTTALVMNGQSDFILKELQPGLASGGVTGFEVPEDALNGTFYLVIEDSGFISKKKLVAELKTNE